MPSSEVFHKWKAGQLHSGSKTGPPVKSHAQAVAIFLSEKRKEGQHGGKYPHRQEGGHIPSPPLTPDVLQGQINQAFGAGMLGPYVMRQARPEDLPPSKPPMDRVWDNYAKNMSESEFLKSEPLWSSAQRIADEQGTPVHEAFANVANEMSARRRSGQYISPDDALRIMGGQQLNSLLKLPENKALGGGVGGGLGILPGTNVPPLPGGVGSMMPPQGLGQQFPGKFGLNPIQPGMRAEGGEVDNGGPPSGDPWVSAGNELRHGLMQIDPAASGMLQRGATPTQEIIPPSSPNVAAAIRRVSAWMQEKAQNEPQPALASNIQIMQRGGPMAEWMAKHMLNTFKPHPSEALPPPVIEHERSGGRIGLGYRADGGNVVPFPSRSTLLDTELAQSPDQIAKNRTNRILSQVVGKQNVLPITPDDKARGGGLGYQFGGSPTSMGLTPGWIERQEARNISHTGPIISAVGGRTDNHPINVPSGSYVLPAAHVSAWGQGNTLNGMQILTRMFGQPMKLPHGAGPPPMRAPRVMGMSSSGGSRGDGHIGRPVPIMAAGGEFVLSPGQVAKVGGGDVNFGHTILDRWVQNTHKKYAKTIANLPPPAKT